MGVVTSDYWGAIHRADPGVVPADTESMAAAAKPDINMNRMAKSPPESEVPPARSHSPHHDKFFDIILTEPCSIGDEESLLKSADHFQANFYIAAPSRPKPVLF